MPDGWPLSPTIYEVYPRSFLDTSGSGVGDLKGVCVKLDYIAGLGVDAIWLAPFYPSPWADGGYDVTDHSAVHPDLGTDDDFDALLREAHDRGLKVIVDQVLNHTSNRHPWFGQSARREQGRDDWYIWRDAKPDGSLPNNWMSYFGMPAWSWDHRRGQYYMHQFLPEQPNLDLRNPEVQEAHRAQMAHWRDRGVDGFRIDAVSSYMHDTQFRDNPPARQAVRDRVAGPQSSPYSMQDHKYDMLPGDGAAFAETIRTWAGDDMYLIGEINTGNQSVRIANDFTCAGRLNAAYTVDVPERGAHAAVLFDLLHRVDGPGRLAGWLGSHDQPRHLNTKGDGSARDARFLAIVSAAMPGPWLWYQGEELGLPQPELSRDETTDPFDLRFWPDAVGREGARVPIPWDRERSNFGFSTAEPWLPMRWAAGLSVAEQEGEPNSVLAFYRRLGRARRIHRWSDGRVRNLSRLDAEGRDDTTGDVVSYELHGAAGAFKVVLNFGDIAARDVCPSTEPLIASDRSGQHMPPRSAAIWPIRAGRDEQLIKGE